MKTILAAAIAAVSFLSSPVIASQLISDEQAGKTLAQVQCGNKSMDEAVRYLNHMGVPAWKLTSPTPGVKRGYKDAMRWKSC